MISSKHRFVNVTLIIATLVGALAGCVDEPRVSDEGQLSSKSPPFLQANTFNHLVSIEGESFQGRQSGTTGNSWQLHTNLAGFSGPGYMEAGPNTGNVQSFTLASGTSLSYGIKFVASGTHELWVRSAACSASNNAIHVALDGAAVIKGWQLGSTCDWTWAHTTMTVPTTGVHTLQILMNEDGFKLDKILITTNPNYAPSATGVGPAESPHSIKFHPGHYIAMLDGDTNADVIDSLRPGVAGVQIRYLWRDLEPTQGNYDFSKVAADLDLLKANGGHLIVLVEDKTFDSKLPVPGYMSSYVAMNKQGGYTTLRWKPFVVTRYEALMQALGAAFDSHPALEGVGVQETALSLADSDLSANGYTPEAMRDAYIDELTAMRDAMPSSQTFWYMNFLVGNQGYLADIASAVAPLGVTMGGPDILPESFSLVQRTYPLYDQFAGKMNLFCSAQFDSYAEPDSATGKDYTPGQIFAFARDQLHVKYVLWNRKTWNTPAGSYNWLDALPVMAANPTFNLSLAP